MTRQTGGPGYQGEPIARSETISNTRNFWRTHGCSVVLVGVLTAAATIMAAFIGLGNDPTSGPAEATVTKTVASPQGKPAGPPESGDSADQQEKEVLWSSRPFAWTSKPNFDLTPPKDNAGGRMHRDELGNLFVGGDGAVWPSQTPPSKQDCVDRLRTHAEQQIVARVGVRMCYRTAAGRTVYLRFLTVPDSPTAKVYETETVIWRQ